MDISNQVLSGCNISCCWSHRTRCFSTTQLEEHHHVLFSTFIVHSSNFQCLRVELFVEIIQEQQNSFPKVYSKFWYYCYCLQFMYVHWNMSMLPMYKIFLAPRWTFLWKFYFTKQRFIFCFVNNPEFKLAQYIYVYNSFYCYHQKTAPKQRTIVPVPVPVHVAPMSEHFLCHQHQHHKHLPMFLCLPRHK